MNRLSINLLPGPGLVLMFVMIAALIGSSALAHDVHDAHDEAHALVQTEAPDTTALVKAFRETGDDEFLDRAWALIEPQLEARPDDADTLINAAMVAQARHEFSRAADLTRKAITIRPNDNQAWLLLASIDLVRGERAEAGAACRRLRDVPMLVSMTCQARVALAGDDAERVYGSFARLLELSEFTGHDGELLAWSLSVAGDLAIVADEPAQAVDFYSQSLDLAESTQVRSALVDVLLETGATETAANVIDAGAPALPLEIRRMIVAQELAHDVAHDIYHAHREFQQWIADEDWLHAREMARFYLDVLDRPELAQRLARINLTMQREPEDLLLAHRAGECSSCVGKTGSEYISRGE